MTVFGDSSARGVEGTGPEQTETGIRYRRLVAADLAQIGDIDRTERIEILYVQRGTQLEERTGDWSASPWRTAGEGEHSVAYQREECELHLAAGATALGAFDGGRLVGIERSRPVTR